MENLTRFKTHCLHGHPLSGDNLTTGKVPQCRKCQSRRTQAAIARKTTGEKPVGHIRVTECKRGHPFTEENTFLYRGRRVCRACKRQYKKHSMEIGAEYIKREYRRANLKKYGLTIENYDAMVESQNGVCAICRNPPIKTRGAKLHVDHCHKTGAVRGLLCGRCNLALGLMEENPARLRWAANYILEAELVIQHRN